MTIVVTVALHLRGIDKRVSIVWCDLYRFSTNYINNIKVPYSTVMFKSQQRLLRSHNQCKGVCHLQSIPKPYSAPYGQTYKRCRQCDVFFITRERNCFCCNTQLRTTSRSTATFSGRIDRAHEL